MSEHDDSATDQIGAVLSQLIAPSPPPPPPPWELDGTPPESPATGDTPPTPGRDGRQRVFRTVPPRLVDEDRSAFRGLRAVLSTLLRQRRRVALSTAVVALGVAYLAGSLSLLGRVSNGLDDLTGVGTERADLVIEGPIAVDTPIEQTRQLVPHGLIPTIEQIPGVAAVSGRIEDTAVLLDSELRPVVPLGLTEQPIGANWPTADELNPYEIVGEGSAPSGLDQVAVDEATAERAGIKVGRRVIVSTKANPRSFAVSAIFRRGERGLPPGSSLVLFEDSTARGLFERQSDDNSIGIALDESADLDQVQRAIAAELPLGAEVVDGPTSERHRATLMSKSFELIRVLLLGFAGLAVIVGAFTVANSNALLFARRRQGFAMLRLVGASPTQLWVGAAIEAALVGVLAVAVGIPLGIAVGSLIEKALSSLGTAIPTAGSPISGAMIVGSAVVGMAVTLLAAVLPAKDAARASPMIALTRSDDHAESGLPVLVRLGGWLAGGGLIGGFIGWSLGHSITAVGMGAGIGMGLFLLVWLLPFALGTLVALATRLLLGHSRAMQSLSALRSRRARSRATATTAALLLATAVVAGLSTLSSSFIASVDHQVTNLVRADLIVDSQTFTRGGLPSGLIESLRSLPGVTAVSGLRVGSTATVQGEAIRLSGMDGASLQRVLSLAIEDPPPRLGPTDVFLSASFAERHRLEVGHDVEFLLPNVAQSFRLAGVYRSESVLLGDAILDTKMVEQLTPSSIDYVALVDLDEGGKGRAATRVRELARSFGVESVVPPEQLVSRRAEVLRGFERVIQWMLLFSVAIAIVGVANTLQLSVNERRRELGLLRAVGGDRSQVIRLVLVEAGALSIVGSVIGAASGVAVAFVAVRILASFGLGTFDMPVIAIVATVSAALSLGVLGAWLPALAAARSGVMEALGEDSGKESSLIGILARFRDARRSRRLSRVQDPRHPGPQTPTGAMSDPGITAEIPGGTEEHMARCYNCGNDPGPAERCVACGAVQVAEPAGMFSTAPKVPGASAAAPPTTPAGQSRSNGGLWSTGRDGSGTEATQRGTNGKVHEAGRQHAEPAWQAGTDDIVDAAIVEEEFRRGAPLGSIFDLDEEVEVAETIHVSEPPRQEPHYAGYDTSRVAYTGTPPPATPYGQPPTPPYQPPPSASQPYGQPQGPNNPPQAPYPPPQAPYPPYSQPQPQYSQPPPPQPAHYGQPGYPPPPNFQSAPPPPTDRYAPPSTSIVHVPAGDPNGLQFAVARMCPDAQRDATPSLLVAGAMLAPDERVLAAVQGWSMGMPAVALLSTGRVLVVCERRWRPIIETFPLRPTLSVYGRHVDGRASMSFQDGERVMTLDQIPDVSLAVEMANLARTHSTHQSF